ncbi:hypothetical protein ACFQZ8_14250, partial [Micromonospora azadirachtae]
PVRRRLRPARRGGSGLVRRRARPAGWDEHEFILKATGRLPLSDRDRSELDDLCDRFPLLG